MRNDEVSLTPHLRPVQNLIEGVWKVAVHVIASEAKQSVAGKEIASSPMAPRNDTSPRESPVVVFPGFHSVPSRLQCGISILYETLPAPVSSGRDLSHWEACPEPGRGRGKQRYSDYGRKSTEQIAALIHAVTCDNLHPITRYLY